MNSDESSPPNAVLERAFAILAAFEGGEETLSLSELRARTDLPKSTVHRLANSLVELGVLRRASGGYGLGRRLFELGSLATSERRLRELAIPFMEDLYETTHETVHLAVLDKVDVLYVEKIHSRGARSIPSWVGGRVPATCTGLGKAMLAYADTVTTVLRAGLPRRSCYSITDAGVFLAELEAVRRTGVAFDREESILGVVCAAAPILGINDVPVGAISVTGPTSRIDIDQLAPAVRAAGKSLTALWRQNERSERLLI